MKVVSDTSPICYLALIGELDLLPVLYERVYIPEAVAAELKHPSAPAIVRNWVESSPTCLEIFKIRQRDSSGLERLQIGEREAIFLAEDLGASLLIMDDRRAREVALKRGLEVTGLLGLIGEAAKRKLVYLPDVFERLRQTSFRTTPQFLQALLDKYPR